MSSDRGERVAKVIARAGLCSRREAERLIAEGRVAVDGVTLESPAVTVGPDNRVTVNGQALPAPEPPRLFRTLAHNRRVLHKVRQANLLDRGSLERRRAAADGDRSSL